MVINVCAGSWRKRPQDVYKRQPNYTPRISGVLHIENGRYNYAMSILKSNNGNPDACNRYTFAYENPVAGEGHFIHTYMHDGNPLPSFEGRCV